MGEMAQALSQRTRIAVAFACVYFFWGSTYGAIHIAGLNLAPPLVGALRTLLAAAILAGYCVVRGISLAVPRRTAGQLALVGVLFMSANNVMLIWAETKVATGYASLVIAMIPILVALMETVLPEGETLTLRGWLGTGLSAIGMGVLVWPSLHRAGGGAGGGADAASLLGFVLLVAAALAFATGSVLSRRFHFRVDTFVATAWQLGAASVVNFAIAIPAGNFRTAVWTRAGVLAVVYLAVFGSVVGLTAYVYLLQHVPVTKVSTYAFVNPVIAVLIGATLFRERMAAAELAGMVLIVAAVATVISSRTKQASTPVEIAARGE
jgi:drug/metabolite transporter (DMT)-like permease